MTASLFLKVSAVWIAILAIGNGSFREGVLAPYLGQGAALPISGISLSIILKKSVEPTVNAQCTAVKRTV